ncbi:Hypothetical_protein [Hexamita inflata]|uniref:Hypothetical_protein n=1 Tax=Hexamita inflata TaxID=28002 RepID=A0AA86UG65_9EUKA|nr:Hypothetical protein HINF_LOCUS44520 [Hexamita inflata]
MTQQIGWRINKDVQPISKDPLKEYKWYESTGWKLVAIKKQTTVQYAEDGKPIKPEDIPGKIWKLNSSNKWCSHVDLSDKNNKPYCNKKDKDYIWNEKTKSWKLAVVIYQKDQSVVVENTRQQNIEQEIEKYYQKKELERLQQAAQVQPVPSQVQEQPIQQQAVQQRPKVVFDNPILNRYNM